MKTSEQILIEWVTDSIRFNAFGIKVWSRKRIELLADVVARRKTKVDVTNLIAGPIIDDAMASTLAVMFDAGPWNVTGRWLAGFDTLEKAEREIRRLRSLK